MAVKTWTGDAAFAPVKRPQTMVWSASSAWLRTLAFATPQACVFLAFVVYSIGCGLWFGSEEASDRRLFADPVYPSVGVNTLLYLLIPQRKAAPGTAARRLLDAQGLV